MDGRANCPDGRRETVTNPQSYFIFDSLIKFKGGFECKTDKQSNDAHNIKK